MDAAKKKRRNKKKSKATSARETAAGDASSLTPPLSPAGATPPLSPAGATPPSAARGLEEELSFKDMVEGSRGAPIEKALLSACESDKPQSQKFGPHVTFPEEGRIQSPPQGFSLTQGLAGRAASQPEESETRADESIGASDVLGESHVPSRSMSELSIRPWHGGSIDPKTWSTAELEAIRNEARQLEGQDSAELSRHIKALQEQINQWPPASSPLPPLDADRAPAGEGSSPDLSFSMRSYDSVASSAISGVSRVASMDPLTRSSSELREIKAIAAMGSTFREPACFGRLPQPSAHLEVPTVASPPNASTSSGDALDSAGASASASLTAGSSASLAGGDAEISPPITSGTPFVTSQGGEAEDLRSQLAPPAGGGPAVQATRPLSDSEDLKGSKARVVALQEQLMHLERFVLQLNSNEVALKLEMSRLRDENFQLGVNVARLEGEKKQLAARLAAVQKGMQQLEREASIRTRVQLDMAAASAVDSSKSWLRWSVEPKGEATAVAEDATMQKAAATAVVEKLLKENASLADQLNEQSALIDRLTHSYGKLAWRSAAPAPPAGFQLLRPPNADVAAPANEGPEQAVPPLGSGMPHLACNGTPSMSYEQETGGSITTAGTSMDLPPAARAFPEGSNASTEVPLMSGLGAPGGGTYGAEQGCTNLHHSVPAVGGFDNRQMPKYLRLASSLPLIPRSLSEGEGMPSAPLVLPGTQPEEILTGGHRKSASLENSAALHPPTSNPRPVGLVQAPIIGAPFRLISFVTRFVTGADLVEQSRLGRLAPY